MISADICKEKQAVRGMLSKLKELTARGFLIVSRILYQIGKSVDPNVDLAHIKRTARLHDMVLHPDEPYYAKQYLHWILRELEKSSPDRNIRILDLACGQGRLSLPMAEWNSKGKVIGVDFTSDAIKKALQYADEKSAGNLEYVVSDVYDYLKGLGSGSVDVVMCIEALYMISSHKEIVDEINRVLMPGGKVFLGFRSQFYNLLDTIRRRRFEDAGVIAVGEEGHILGSPVWYSWHTGKQIIENLGKAGFKDIRCHGIGLFSGIEGDPLEHIARPSLLTEKEQEALFEIETDLSRGYADCGRYILAIAVK
jgi:SAM-dependent methyltransferase